MSAETVMVILTFEDQDGREWLSAAEMTPLQLAGTNEECQVGAMLDRAFVLKGFRVVTDAALSRVDLGGGA